MDVTDTGELRIDFLDEHPVVQQHRTLTVNKQTTDHQQPPNRYGRSPVDAGGEAHSRTGNYATNANCQPSRLGAGQKGSRSTIGISTTFGNTGSKNARVFAAVGMY